MPGEGRHLGPRRDMRRELILLLAREHRPLTTTELTRRMRQNSDLDHPNRG